jgi:N-acetylmuramic acid 6-phosphate etherase
MKITESDSPYTDLEKKSVLTLLTAINREDQKVAPAVMKSIRAIEKVVNAALKKLHHGGRLFYLGSGTSGRLGILDASECPPTFGVDHGLVIGLIAGGDEAIRKAIEKAEDDLEGGWNDLKKHHVCSKDFVIGISSSGTTPYVIGALQQCSKNEIETGCITSNPDSPLSKEALYPIEIIVGPEFITGSTRMKSGTAQKLVLNMITTTIMIRMGKVKGNKMIDLQLNNNKLVDRGTRIIEKELNISYEEANAMLLKYGSVRKALNEGSKE